MCDVCKLNGNDPKFLNGKKNTMKRSTLYRILVGKQATVTLCHIHDIELFHLGEKRFVMEHVNLLRVLSNKN